MINEECTKVIVINSLNDGLTKKRIERNQGHPYLKKFDIKYLYAIDLIGVDKLYSYYALYLKPENISVFSYSDKKELFYSINQKKNAIIENIEKEINAFPPEIIIFHSGIIFREFQPLFSNILHELVKKHPNIKFGLEDTFGYIKKLNIIDFIEKNEDVEILIEHLF